MCSLRSIDFGEWRRAAEAAASARFSTSRRCVAGARRFLDLSLKRSEGLIIFQSHNQRGLGFQLIFFLQTQTPLFRIRPGQKANNDAPRDRPLPLSGTPLGPRADRGQPCRLGGPAGGTVQVSVVGDDVVADNRNLFLLSRSALSRPARFRRGGRGPGRLLPGAAGVRGAPGSAFHGAS